jgi:hypothetical protein
MVFRSTAVLVLKLDYTWGWVVSPTLWPLYPQGNGFFTDKRSGWVCPRAGLDTEHLAPPEFDHRTIQPVAGSYTNYTTLALLQIWHKTLPQCVLLAVLWVMYREILLLLLW